MRAVLMQQPKQPMKFVYLLVLLPRAAAYLRSAVACSGTQVIDSIGECATAVAAINAAGGSSATSVAVAAATSWPQGCFYHVNAAFWQPSTSTGGSTPTPDDSGNAYICRSGFAANYPMCNPGTEIASFADCMEASEVVAVRWTTYERSASQCATGSTALVSDGECSSAAGGSWAPQPYASAVMTEWPQGCFINGGSIYSQDELQQSTGQLTPTASDGGNVYICRKETDPGTDWPQGCFVHNGVTWYSASAGSNIPDGGMVCSTGYGSGASGDPHIVFAHGGKADFRGSHRQLYNFISSPGYQFAPYFQEVDFWFDTPTGLKQLVHGTFMTKATWRVRTNKGREVLLKVDAMDRAKVDMVVLDYSTLAAAVAASSTGAALTGDATFKPASLAAAPQISKIRTLPPYSNVSIDDVSIKTYMLTTSVETASWQVNVTSKPIWGLDEPVFNQTHYHLHWDPSQRRLDVSIVGAFPQPDAHGIVGQSYRDSQMRSGKVDEYGVQSTPELANSDGRLPDMTTSAQAEGAIDGIYTDYIVASPFDVGFRFSRYNAEPPVRVATTKRTAATAEWDGRRGHWQGTNREMS